VVTYLSPICGIGASQSGYGEAAVITNLTNKGASGVCRLVQVGIEAAIKTR
jgi:hypothetical protein